MKTIPKLAAALLLAAAALLPAQAQNARAPDTTPLAEPNMPALIKGLGLVESKLPARQFIKGWRPPKKIIVTLDNNIHRLDWLKEAVPPGVQLVAVRSPQEALQQAADADAYIGSCSKEIVAAAGPNFHWVHVNYAGVEACFTGDVPARLKDGTIAVSNTQKVTGNAVAGNAIAAMMALSRGMDEYAKMNVTKKFTTEPYPRLWSLQGRTILIAGLGGIGTAMANMAHGLGMRVIATNAVIPDNAPDWIEHIGLPDELGAMVGQADVVMVGLPLTDQTSHLFNAAMFAKFKKGAIFVNDTREEIEVDADLIAAVESGQLSSASVDSMMSAPGRNAPLSPLVGVKNILVTPYIASQNVDPALGRGGETTWDVARENLRRFARGDALLSVVDPVKGY
jgi:phosphoglycerate dehydrogenase-like enzyme